MPTPRREIKAVADVLTDEANADCTAEQVAQAAIEALDEVRSRTQRLAVIGKFRWYPDGQDHVAVLGPFSTRAESAARAAGAGFTGSAQHHGSGGFMLVPAFANTRAAWDAIKPDDAHEKRLRGFLAGVDKAHPQLFNPWVGFGPTCCCGVRSGGYCRVHGKTNP